MRCSDAIKGLHVGLQLACAIRQGHGLDQSFEFRFPPTKIEPAIGVSERSEPLVGHGEPCEAQQQGQVGAVAEVELIGVGVDSAGNRAGIGGIAHSLGDHFQQIPVIRICLALQGEGQVGQHLVGIDLGVVTAGGVGGAELLLLNIQLLVETAD